jgi:hypothetical protein
LPPRHFLSVAAFAIFQPLSLTPAPPPPPADFAISPLYRLRCLLAFDVSSPMPLLLYFLRFFIYFAFADAPLSIPTIAAADFAIISPPDTLLRYCFRRHFDIDAASFASLPRH